MARRDISGDYLRQSGEVLLASRKSRKLGITLFLASLVLALVMASSGIDAGESSAAAWSICLTVLVSCLTLLIWINQWRVDWVNQRPSYFSVKVMYEGKTYFRCQDVQLAGLQDLRQHAQSVCQIFNGGRLPLKPYSSYEYHLEKREVQGASEFVHYYDYTFELLSPPPGFFRRLAQALGLKEAVSSIENSKNEEKWERLHEALSRLCEEQGLPWPIVSWEWEESCGKEEMKDFPGQDIARYKDIFAA